MKYYYEANADISDYCYLHRQMHPYAEQHFHTAIEMIIVRSGKMLATIDGKDYTLSEGEGCFVNKLLLHAYKELLPGTEVYVLVGDGILWAPVFSDVGGMPTTTFAYDDFDLIERAKVLFQSQNTRISAFKGLISFICSAVAVKEIGETSKGVGFDLSPVLFYIDEHFREDCSLTTLASRFGYSPQYFSKTFHRYMKVNLPEYVNMKRVSFAHSMLNTKRSVAEIAYESGFSSTTSFYRAYKKVFDKLPRD